MTAIKLWSAVGCLAVGFIIILYPLYGEASLEEGLLAFLFGAALIGWGIIDIRKLWRELKKGK